MNFEDKIRLLRKLKEAKVTDAKAIEKLTTKDMLVISKKNYATIEGLVELQDNVKDIFTWLMNDDKG